jgi:HAD superfamily hydrolase (TIGR01490 family)
MDAHPDSSSGSVVAFFDVDETIVRGNSAQQYAMEAYRHGELSHWDALRLIGWILLYRLRLIEMRPWMERASTLHAGVDEGDFADRSRALYNDSLANRLDPEVVARINEHRERGHRLVLLTATLRQVAIPLLEHLGFHDILSNELNYRDGTIIGGFVEPLCYGEGKVVHALQFMEKRAFRFEDAYFYSDSIADLPMLEAVGHPVVVNPDRRLRKIAQSRGWPGIKQHL